MGCGESLLTKLRKEAPVPFLIVAAASRAVNEFTGACCQPSNNTEAAAARKRE